MKARKLEANQQQKSQREILFSRDIWYATELGMTPSSTHSSYRLNFSKVNPIWFRDILKKFIHFQSSTKAYFTCCSYITGLRHFGNFIAISVPDMKPEQINRAVVVDYLNYLNIKGLKVVARQMALIHLRTFLEIVSQEEWLPITKIPIIYSSDLPKTPSSIPRFIPEIVMEQLKTQIPT